MYDDFRRLLGDELGIEPSPALVAQHAGLLGGADAAPWAPTTRLPLPVTSLVGRDDARSSRCSPSPAATASSR